MQTLLYIYIYIYTHILRKNSKFGGHGPTNVSPLDFGCSRVEKRVFSSATNNHRTISLALFRNRRVGCQFHVYVPFGKICGKVVYICCGLIFQVKKKEKRTRGWKLSTFCFYCWKSCNSINFF